GPGLGISLGIDVAVQLGLVHLQVVIVDRTLVEAVESQLRAVGRPPHRGCLTQLLTVDPARAAVLDPLLEIPLGGHRPLAAAIGHADVHVPVAVEGPPTGIGGEGLGGLTPPGHAPAAPSAAATRFARVGLDFGSTATLDVVAVLLAVE